MLGVVRCLLALLLLLASGEAADPAARLTPKQAAWIAERHAAAKEASLRAEASLLETLNSPIFKARLAATGAGDLARLDGAELLRRLKASLRSMEYSYNFGIDEATRQRHPGESAMNLTTVDQFGYLVTLWELKATKDPLVSGIPSAQWAVMDEAEHHLLGFPSIGGQPYDITREQARERPQYANGNTRHIDMGIQRYGSYSAVVRNDVMRARAVTDGGDSGGWEDVCNKSLPPLKPWFHDVGFVLDCDAMVIRDESGRQLVGSTEHQLHTLVSNYNVFGRVGGGLPRLVRQMLDPHATFAPAESLMYIEGLVIAAPRPDELKLMVASFADVFGTADGDAVRDFCRRWKIPLAWAIGGGRPFSAEEADVKAWIPVSPFVQWPVAADRLLDTTAWEHTNATQRVPSVDAVAWSAVEAEVKQHRSRGGELTKDVVQGWWQRLAGAGGVVRQLVAEECADVDYCFGTIATEANNNECVCARRGGGEQGTMLV